MPTDRPPKTTSAKQRLDVALAERGLVASRARARDLIRRGLVEVAGARMTRPSTGLAANEAVRILSALDAEQVSRGGAKLRAALKHFRYHPAGKVALDIGASAGGFTEVLLEHRAACVYAVDVGHGQLHPRLARDPRVVPIEGCDARSLGGSQVPEMVDAIVADVSFISLTQALPAALALAAPKAWLIALIKPQFEAGRGAVGKGGIVRSAAARQHAVTRVVNWVADQSGWRVEGVIPSPIDGASGNAEFLLGAIREP